MNTIEGATITGTGVVPHYKHPAGILCPVRLVQRLGAMVPERRVGGRYVYALPGGRSICPRIGG